MSKYDTKKLLAHLNQKWHGRQCPMCGIGNWEVNDSIFMLIEFQGGSVVIGGPVVPVIPVSCVNCGNTILVNALVSGALQPPKPQSTKPGGAP